MTNSDWPDEVTVDQILARMARGPEFEADMASFANPSVADTIDRMREGLTDTHDTAMRFGILVLGRWVFRAYARYLWLQNRKPRAIYRGGRWRQMRNEMKAQARFWALSQ
jgi:hypothetical protein